MKVLRNFRKDFRLNVINILSMALGIAASVIIFGYVFQEFNYDTQLENSERIYQVLTNTEGIGLSSEVNYAPLAESLNEKFPEIEAVNRVSFYYGYLALTAGDNMYNEHEAIFADPGFFKLFSFPLKQGNIEQCLESHNSVVISSSAAKKYFGETEPLNQQIKIGSENWYTVMGVYEDFPVNSNFNGDIVLPLKSISKLTQVWIEPSWEYPSDIHTFVLLEANTNQYQIAQKIRGFVTGYVKDNKGELILQPIKQIHTDNEVSWEARPLANKGYLYLLIAVALTILFSSTINFLFLYNGLSARRYIYTEVKKVCGASKANILNDHIKETLFYTLVSLVIAVILVIAFQNLRAGHYIAFSFIGLKNKMIFYLILIITAQAIVSTIVPAWIVSKQKNRKLIKSATVNAVLPKRTGFQVIGQFTVTIGLLAVAILFYKQLHFLQSHDPGYERDELITIPLNMHMGEGIYNENMDVFTEELKKQAGIENVTLAFSSPVNVATSMEVFDWEGRTDNKQVPMQWNIVFFDYFETLGLEMVEGRGFSHEFPSDMLNFDNRKCSFILNQKAVKEMGLENPIGKNFSAYGDGPIVGVVEDFNFRSLHSEISPMCFSMNPVYYNEIIVRFNPQVANVLEGIEVVWQKFVPDYPLEFSYVTDQLDQLYSPEKKLIASINAFSIVAIIISCMGLLAHTVLTIQGRVKEIGIRKVNGARTREVITMLNIDLVKWIGFSLAIAIPVAWLVMNKWLENFAYKTTMSWWVFALAGVFAILIAIITVSWQSWQAAARNPVEALRYE